MTVCTAGVNTFIFPYWFATLELELPKVFQNLKLEEDDDKLATS